MSEYGCPSKGGSFGHVGESESNHLAISVIDSIIDKEVEAYSVQPLCGFLVGAVKGFRCSNVEFCGF